MFWEHFRYTQNRGILGISKPSQYFDSHSKKKNGSTFVEVSIESSEFRAFRGALMGGASYFHSKVMFTLASLKCYFLDDEKPKIS